MSGGRFSHVAVQMMGYHLILNEAYEKNVFCRNSKLL